MQVSVCVYQKSSDSGLRDGVAFSRVPNAIDVIIDSQTGDVLTHWFSIQLRPFLGAFQVS